MLEIIVPSSELYDEINQCFITSKETKLQLEHSLVSISKWESKYHKPFLVKEDKTKDELIFYIKCMTLTQNVDANIYNFLTEKNFKDISDYINDPMTATTFSDQEENRKKQEIITNEVIYYLMVSFNIPFECQKWHINRLLTLIKVCSEKNKPEKKNINKNAILANNRNLNEIRRKALHSKG